MSLVVGNIYDDLKCIAYEGKNNASQNIYTMQCIICGRTKSLKDYVVNRHTGTTHNACGKGLKTLDKKFYSIWKSMRTRTTNPNYWASEHYSEKGIDSDEFALFIDFYDKMYNSYKKAYELYGDDISLERIDTDKSYSVENCTWIHKNMQPCNTSRVRRFEAIAPDGTVYIERNVAEFCRKHNLIHTYVACALLNDRSRTWYSDWKFRYLDDN